MHIFPSTGPMKIHLECFDVFLSRHFELRKAIGMEICLCIKSIFRSRLVCVIMYQTTNILYVFIKHRIRRSGKLVLVFIAFFVAIWLIFAQYYHIFMHVLNCKLFLHIYYRKSEITTTWPLRR